jgi:hypothetical protein
MAHFTKSLGNRGIKLYSIIEFVEILKSPTDLTQHQWGIWYKSSEIMILHFQCLSCCVPLKTLQFLIFVKPVLIKMNNFIFYYILEKIDWQVYSMPSRSRFPVNRLWFALENSQKRARNEFWWFSRRRRTRSNRSGITIQKMFIIEDCGWNKKEVQIGNHEKWTREVHLERTTSSSIFRFNLSWSI